MKETQPDGSSDLSKKAVEYLDGLYGYAVSLTRNAAEAEDLVQQTFLRAKESFGNLRLDENLKTWLYAILRNLFLNQVRRRKNGPRFIEMDNDEAPVLPTDDRSYANRHAMYLDGIEQRQVRSAVESLPDVYREVIILRDFEDFSYGQIAEILRCPAGTVMSRLGRARGKLRETLERLRGFRRIELEGQYRS